MERCSLLRESNIGPNMGRDQMTVVKRRKSYRRQKVCKFCVDKVEQVDYKDVRRLRSFVTERGRILPRRISGTCAPHQRQLTVAVKRARNIALLPFVADIS